jgi:cytidylate kinase
MNYKDYLNYLPQNTGIKLVPTTLENKKKLNYVICIDGLAGVGKSTLGHALSAFLKIPHISSGIFYRVFTYIFFTYNLDFTEENITKIAFDMTFDIREMQLVVFYKGKEVPLGKLKNKDIDGLLNQYSTNLFFRQVISDILVKMTTTLQYSFILDLRGSSPKYVTALEEQNRPVIRFLLVTDLATKVNRRMVEYHQATKEQEDKIKQDITLRDTQDIESIKKTGIGLIHENTGILDTSNLNEEEVLITALQFILQSLG